ncbi:uncharacterized protein LOC115759318 [Drosophila novamexicana]|uniref:uncharacterized protein LOC115759318 n=1 Tax=Drosophila novamexicana TaxID=47314 RepID=UPI0011E607BB|nr:uncharacterized protein LOC115759318 [Drosophila novamexicana]
MQPHSNFLKSIMPVQIYKSTSAIYMTCLSKLSISAFVPECNQKLAVEQAIVQALDETIMPHNYAERQEEAEELLHRSQTNFREVFAPPAALQAKKVAWGNNTTMWIDSDDEVHRPLHPIKAARYDRIYRAHCRGMRPQQMVKRRVDGPATDFSMQDLIKAMFLMGTLTITIYLIADLPF